MFEQDDEDAVFKALAHRLRRQLLDLLREGPRTTGALCEALPERDRCTVMQHLSVLEGAGLIVAERRGRERWNHLNALPIRAIQDRWIGPHADHAVRMLQAMEQEPD